MAIMDTLEALSQKALTENDLNFIDKTNCLD
jgi:hypothetical protein